VVNSPQTAAVVQIPAGNDGSVLQRLLATLTGWLDRREQEIAYKIEKNRL
jgi:hypothetical protein